MKILGFLKFIFLIASLQLPLLNIAATFTVDKDNIRYTVDDEAMTAEVYGPVSSSATITNLVIPDFIEYNDTQIPVTSIRNNAFYWNKNLKGSLTIGDNVQTVGDNAFDGCSGFTGSLIIPNNVKTIGANAFARCSGFTGSLTIGDNVQLIGNSAFVDCSGFTGSLIIPDKVKTIGDYAFYRCSGLNDSLVIGENLSNIPSNTFNYCEFVTLKYNAIDCGSPQLTPFPKSLQTAIIGESVINIPQGFLRDHRNLKSLIIGNNVENIGELAFYYCENLSGSLIIPNKVKIIGRSAFKSCGFTGDVVLGRDLERVEESAFNFNQRTQGNIIFNEKLQYIGDGAFSGNFVGDLILPNSLKYIGENAFWHGQYNGYLKLPENIEYIGNNAFESCKQLKGNIELPETLEFIGYGAFEACIQLKGNLKIPSKIKTIYGRTFEMVDIQYIDIHENVTSIGNKGDAYYESFEGNTFDDYLDTNNPNIDYVICRATQPPTMYGSSNFFSTTYEYTPLYVPNGSVELYKNAKDWKNFKYINPIPVEATNITIDKSDLKLFVGQEETIIATLTPEDASTEVKWSVENNNSIISVDQNGKVTALEVGTANVIATAGEISATCKVTVYGPDDVTVKPGDGTTSGNEEDTSGNNTENGGSLVGNDLTLRVNQTASIDLVIPEGLSLEPKFAWSLDNGGAELVNMTVKNNTLSATFKGLKVGQTGYTVSIIGVNGNIEAVKGKIIVIAEVPMSSLELDPASITMAQNALPQTIKPVYSPENASMPEFNWTSTVPTVASVDQNGKVTPVGQGQTIITATALDGSGLSATSNVTVTAPIDEDFGFDESVMGGVEGVTIYLGDSYTLVPKAHDGYQLPENIVWSSSDDKIVSVDQNGKVTGLALGSATISATATINGKEITATCTVTVIPIKVSTIELSQTTAELRATETLTLTATIEPDNATDKSLQWTTNAPSIATVSQDGVVTALMVGEANITARALDGSNVTASCKVTVVPTIANGISVKANGSTEIKATETVQLTATVTPETTTDKTVTWKSDKPAIAIVNNSGVVTGIAVGEAIITATNSAGQTADIKITIVPTQVEVIELNRYSAQIKVQDGFQLTANILPLTATNKNVSWTSSAPEIVSVDNEGNVLALALGNATITCEAQDGSGVKAECQITVTTTATQSVSISAEGSTTLKATETVQLKATVLPVTASDKSVRWQSANPDIATVDNTGLVTAVSVGTVQITATNSGGQTASVTITVIPTLVESIKLNKTSATLKATETLALIATVNPETATDKSLEWTSDNEAVATVNQNGVVTAIATGEANIIVKAKDGSNVTATCKVNVIATEVNSITITANGSTTLKASENVQLTATILPETATDKSVTWSASAPGIANVNENGLVTAYAVGESLITATASSGMTAEITITVIPTPVSNITLNRTTLTMRVGNENKLSATVLPETAIDKTVTWASSNPEIATVDADGNVKALLEGQTSIICTANDGSGISASCIVNVVDTDVETVTITAEGSTTLKVSGTVQLTATVIPETSTDKTITWSSGNEKVATVDANGLVTAISEGVAVITATTSNGLSDSITVTVVETQVTSITLNETSIILQANETYSLIPTINPQTATNKEVIWSSGNADIATVNQDGTVTAVKIGETTVTATAADGSGVTATCKVTVIATPATSIKITVHGETTLEINQSVQLTAEVLPENATDKSVVWTSSNEAVAKVTETGLVTALAAGETVITATNSAGQYDRVTITVLSNEPDEPIVPEPVVTPADTPTQLLRKGDGTSHTFVAMMEKDDEVLEAEEYRYVFGYSNQTDGTAVIEDTPWRYTHTTESIYWNSANDFWVFAYYVDDEGTLHASSRRHLDGSVDSDFNAADLIGGASRSGEHIIGIYTVDGQYVGKELNNLTNGIYIVRSSNSTYKIIK